MNCATSLEKWLLLCGFDIVDMIPTRRPTELKSQDLNDILNNLYPLIEAGCFCTTRQKGGIRKFDRVIGVYF